MRCPKCAFNHPADTDTCYCGYTFTAQDRVVSAGGLRIAPAQAPPGLGQAPVEALAYSPSDIDNCARRRYSLAASIVRSATVTGALVAAVALGALGYMATKGTSGALVGGVVGLIIGGLMGYEAGMNRAVLIKLQAQVALCTMQIEWNTRK